MENNLTALNYSLNYGLAVWEGVRAYEGSVLYLEKHAERLHKSAEKLAIFKDIPSVDEIATKIFRAFWEGPLHQFAYARPIIYVNADERTASAAPLPAKFEVFVMPVKSIYEKEYTLLDGINVAYFDDYEGFAKDRLTCHPEFLKMPGNYVQADRMRLEANRKLAGAATIQETLFFDKKWSVIVEGGFSNIFGAVTDPQYLPTLVVPSVTPNMLDGITRQWVLKNHDLTTKKEVSGFGRFGMPFKKMDELFMVGTHMEIKSILNVYQIKADGFEKVWTIGSQGNFAVADRLRAKYRETVFKGEHL